MTVSVVLDHLLISLGAWAAGVIFGGALGTLLALGARTWFASSSILRRLSTLMPWRTAVMSLLIVVWTPASAFVVGLGIASGMLNTGLVMFLLALPFTVSVLFERWYPSMFAVRLIAGLRTLATASLVVAAFVGFYDGTGIGWFMYNSLILLKFDLLFQEWLALATLVLITDISLGIVQLVVSNLAGKTQMLHSVNQTSQPAG